MQVQPWQCKHGFVHDLLIGPFQDFGQTFRCVSVIVNRSTSIGTVATTLLLPPASLRPTFLSSPGSGPLPTFRALHPTPVHSPVIQPRPSNAKRRQQPMFNSFVPHSRRRYLTIVQYTGICAWKGSACQHQHPTRQSTKGPLFRPHGQHNIGTQ